MSAKPKLRVRLRAKAECPSHSLANVEVRDVAFAIDEPEERGGTNKGPAPTETAIAALIGCTNTIGHKCAKSLGIEIGHLDISAVCDFDRRGVTLEEEVDLPFMKIALRVETSSAVTDADLERLTAEVAKFCPLSKLFKQAGTEIEEEWVSGG